MNIYLDNAASTKIDERVLDAMLPFMKEYYGNPSSIHKEGKYLKVLVEEARETIASFLGTKPKEIFFTSGGTEANNFAIKGLAFSNADKNKNHLITSTIEHPAVLDTILYLKKFGYSISLVAPGSRGFVSPAEIEKLITPRTLLVSVMHANNELGSVNDVKAISNICKKNKVVFHSDTVQSVGKMKVSPKESGMDFMTMSAHKIYGPKGVGILFKDENIRIDKYFHGGGQERDMRGGTENVPGIAGLKKAVEILKESMDADIVHYNHLKEILKTKLSSVFGENVEFNSGVENVLPNILNVSFNPYKMKIPEALLPVLLDLKGISVSGGSACSSGSLKPSKVLIEIGKDEKTALSSIRISLGRFNKEEDVDALTKAMKEILNV
ncbi:MAG: cysteine desulfurase family protein [Ignavibacteria bacterium]|nr:cysteine desulfurase family protein [Ignavibacteria bacterium]